MGESYFLDSVKNVSHKELLKVIQRVRNRIKNSETIQNAFKEYDVPIEWIDLIPMRFGEIDVSAKTLHGCITFNYKLLGDKDFDNDDHYMVHEIKHWLQQCFSEGPTEGSADDTYLDNKYEQDGFQTQTKYLSETRGDEAANEYVDQVLDHHGVHGNERKEKKNELLELAHSIAKTLKLG